MLRPVLGAFAGYALIGILVVFTDQLFSVFTRGFDTRPVLPSSYFLLSLFTDTFYSFVGGYLCAAIAQKDAKQAALGMISAGEIIGLVATVLVLWRASPHWFAPGLLILYPPAVWFGSRLRARGLDLAI